MVIIDEPRLYACRASRHTPNQKIRTGRYVRRSGKREDGHGENDEVFKKVSLTLRQNSFSGRIFFGKKGSGTLKFSGSIINRPHREGGVVKISVRKFEKCAVVPSGFFVKVCPKKG